MLKVNDFFSGAGGMGIAFDQAGFILSGAWDFDKYAVESYSHNVSELVKQSDILKMTYEDVPYADVWTYGFPCQDISLSGKQKGMIKGVTRSGLFYEIMRLLKETETNLPENLPKIILAENVKNVGKYLSDIEAEYNARGYKMYCSLYNSKYWSVPQNRERYFILGVHESIEKEFKFPVQVPIITVLLRDILEKNVDEKYFVEDLEKLKIVTREIDHYTIKQATKKGYIEAYPGDSMNISHPKSKTRRGRVGKQVAQTIITSPEQLIVLDDLRLRYFTPRELARLQGFPETFNFVVPEVELQKQFGNAVTVPLVREIALEIKNFLQN